MRQGGRFEGLFLKVANQERSINLFASLVFFSFSRSDRRMIELALNAPRTSSLY
jgi:hypothetical protein